MVYLCTSVECVMAWVACRYGNLVAAVDVVVAIQSNSKVCVSSTWWRAGDVKMGQVG